VTDGTAADGLPSGRARTCRCHFPDGSDGVYAVEHDQLLRGTRTTITGLEGVWVVTELSPPGEAEIIDAELWVRPATDDELASLPAVDTPAG